MSGRNVLGFGYAAPFLAGFDTAARTVALMPAPSRCPPLAAVDGAGRAALAREDELPLADGSIDRVLLVHALECCGNVPRLIREIWRVLADGGRMIVVVPNRRGLWCLSDRTPFGHGQPYSRGQLERTLNGHLFAPRPSARHCSCRRPSRACSAPRHPGRAAGLSLHCSPRVVLVEAEKQIYVADRRAGLGAQPRAPLRAGGAGPGRRPGRTRRHCVDQSRSATWWFSWIAAAAATARLLAAYAPALPHPCSVPRLGQCRAIN